MTAVMTPEQPPAHLHPAYATAPRPMRVVAVRALTADITHFRFGPVEGPPAALTAYQPGSHLILTAGEHRNAYSLTDDGMFPLTYGISVLRRGAGGGSDWLHDNLSEGSVVEVEGPRSMFAPVLEQRGALLVAGGIGVTPVLSHARALARTGRRADIVYSYRPGQGAHADDLRALAEQPQITLYEVSGTEATAQLLAERLRVQPLGTHAYACGPGSLLEAYTELAADAGWPAARVHLERFTAPDQAPGDPFTATLTSTGATIDVPAGVSLLQRLLDNGVAVPNLCRQGVCGECRIPVRRGSIEHRDFVLTDDEKAAGEAMLCCVSRGQDIEVDL
ncbi:oxidoreductase [Gordonia sp. zg691]|uniref:Oxidoreductase n=1 Tax=Gordonia jinghuaiqii TaxID=2758710 RepID=A0A7D7LRI2_9ACTN|nr:PDR/VanB family oxidoreductase [Gordonia jinghuaiqii]MBD0862782.1 oxidoreductase [Gordonia jinghuaiqii]MCR5979095.1 2Fe-2S iron-sulfur cluster binding domain-containing protein [Gordonia jinghuaiqii]QMT01585.1 oxidoreductase [Gordonia jinghuaiqii]